MATPRHASLGLTVPVSEVLDPSIWRAGYAYNVALGRGAAPPELAIIDGLPQGCAPSVAPYGGISSAAADAACSAADELPDESIRMHLRAALSLLETRLQIPLGTVIVKGIPVDAGLVQGVHYDRVAERLPYKASDVDNYYRVDLPPGVISVERVRVFWRSQLVWEVTGPANADTSSIRLATGHTQLHLMPLTGTLFALWPITDPPRFSLLQQIMATPRPMPDAWSVDYTLGPVTATGQVGHIEYILAHWARMQAALTLLPLASAARTQGVAGASIGMDGLSKSVQLAGGGMSSMWVSIEQAYRQALAEINLDRLAVQKRGITIRGMGY